LKLHENTKDFLAAIQATSQATGIREVFIEKDYWVCYILKSLSDSPFKDEVIFKGGTSLSKAHKMIHRFSEAQANHAEKDFRDAPTYKNPKEIIGLLRPTYEGQFATLKRAT